MVTVRLALLSALTGVFLSIGCAHAQPSAADVEAEEKQERELARLRDRMNRIERRFSDVDAQLRLLTERPPSAAYQPAAPPPSGPSAPPPEAPYALAAAEPWADKPGMQSIDLPNSSPSVAPDDDLSSTPEFRDVAIDDVSADSSDGAGSTMTASAPTQVPPEELYEWARARHQESRYLEAMNGYQELLDQHADHHLADNALYWIADCHLARGDARQAIDVWRRLPLRFPKSPKLPDSLFGMAQAHERLGEPALAETLYAQLIAQYPRADRTPQARKAVKRLSGSPGATR